MFVGMCGERLGCLEGEMCLRVEEEMGNEGVTGCCVVCIEKE